MHDRWVFRLAAALLGAALLVIPKLAYPQGATVYQNGDVIPGHLAKWFTTGRIGDAGGLQGDGTGDGLAPFGINDKNGLGLCSNSGLTTKLYNAFCFGHDDASNALITVDSYNGLGPKGLSIRLNGTSYPFPGPGGGNVIGPTNPPPVAGNQAIWNGGLTLKDGGPQPPSRTTSVTAGPSDVTTALQTDMNAFSAQGGGVYQMPTGKKYIVGGPANLVIPYNVQIKCSDHAGGYWPNSDFAANADFLIDPAHSISSESPAEHAPAGQTSGKGGRSGIIGCSLVRLGLPATPTLRGAIEAIKGFSGTAFVCQPWQTDVIFSQNLVIGFSTGVQSSCDRLQFHHNKVDATNGFAFLQCYDSCEIHDNETWPFVGNPYGTPGDQSQTTAVTSATFSGNTLTLGFAAPPMPLVTGDTVTVGKIGGITGAQYGRFTATVVDGTHISVNGTFSGTYTTGGTIRISSLQRHGTAFKFGAGGGPWAYALVDFGHDVGLHYAGTSNAQCQNCWLDNDTSTSNPDPVPVALKLDGNSGLVNGFQGYTNTPGTAIYKNDASILTVGPATQLFSLNTGSGSYVIQALKGSIRLVGVDVFTEYGAGPGQAIYIGSAFGAIFNVGSNVNGTLTTQTPITPCGTLVNNGASGPCVNWTPTYTGVTVAGTPLHALYWQDPGGKTVVYFEDAGKALTGQTAADFTMNLPSTPVFGGVCTLGLISANFPASTSQFMVAINGGAPTIKFFGVGSRLTTPLPGTALGTPNVLQFTCTYS